MSNGPGDLIAYRYVLVAPIGEGGQGRIWHARDELLSRDVAIKELVPPSGVTGTERQEIRERTLREARAIARLDHPAVVKVFDVVSHQDEPWIVMELVTARSLGELITQDGPQPPDWTATMGLSVLGALRAAHDAGILHRDVKPANVLIADDGRVLLTDFGLATVSGDASVTETGMILGSPAYLAPERALGESIGPPSDLWSLGATLYAAVEGRAMFGRSTPVATLAAVATEKPPPPRRAGALRPALDGLLRRDPSLRATAEQAEALLRRAIGADDTTSRIFPVRAEPAFATTSGQSPRRIRILAGAAALAVLLAVGATLVNGRLRPVDASAAVVASTAAHPTDPPAPAAAPSSAAQPTVVRTVTVQAAPPKTPKPTRTRTAPPKPYQIIGEASNRCIEIPDQIPKQNGGLHVWDCRPDAPGQRWTLAADGTLRSGGMCVDTRFGATGDGTLLVTATCTPNLKSQQFHVDTADGYLLSSQSGRCVDVKDQATANGSALQIWTCGGTGNQRWRLYPFNG